MSNEPRTFVVERRSIEFIPESERHGSVFSLFTLWFAANMQITTVVTGALAVIIGLPLLWALVAVVVGNLLEESSWHCTPLRGRAWAFRR